MIRSFALSLCVAFQVASTASETSCRESIEYSVKLNLNKLRNRHEGIKHFHKILNEIAANVSWLTLKEKKQPMFEVVDFLDDDDGSFKAIGTQVRFRRNYGGMKVGRTDLVVKTQNADRHAALAKGLAQPAVRWMPFWHCKIEANIYPSGAIVWQESSKTKTLKKHDLFAHAFPDIGSLKTVANLEKVYPGLIKHVYGDSHSAATRPLVKYNREYRWQENVDIMLGNASITATVTLQYRIRPDLEVNHVDPINADFEYKCLHGSDSWTQRDHAVELMHLLGATDVVNNSFVGAAARVPLALHLPPPLWTLSSVIVGASIASLAGMVALYQSQQREQRRDIDDTTYVLVDDGIFG